MLDLLKIDPSYTKRRRSTPKEGEIFELVPHTTSIITIFNVFTDFNHLLLIGNCRTI